MTEANDFPVLGTLKDPIMVKSFGDEQYCGCTGFPADSHVTKWLTVSSIVTSWCSVSPQTLFRILKDFSTNLGYRFLAVVQ